MGSASPTLRRLEELRHIYAAIEREHRHVTLNTILRSLANVSDILAIDRSEYQTGESIVCRVHVSQENMRSCKERPFLAMVPKQLEIKVGARDGGTWFLNGQKVNDPNLIGCHLQELPQNPSGTPQRDCCLRLLAPFISTSEQCFEVRIYASSNGRDPLRQVGRSVPFQLLAAAPLQPLVDNVTLSPVTGEASVILNWSMPPGHLPIRGFIVKVEPEQTSQTLLVDHMVSNCAVDSTDEDERPKLKEVEVWSPAIKGFKRKLSYSIVGLQRGVA
jgi:hypothetical protein